MEEKEVVQIQEAKGDFEMRILMKNVFKFAKNKEKIKSKLARRKIL